MRSISKVQSYPFDCNSKIFLNQIVIVVFQSIIKIFIIALFSLFKVS